VKALAPQHPEWKSRTPFASVLQGDMSGIAAAGEKGVLTVMAAAHTGMTTEEFSSAVREWIASARHPKTGRLYTEMVSHSVPTWNQLAVWLEGFRQLRKTADFAA
jgi:hypothetical protein